MRFNKYIYFLLGFFVSSFIYYIAGVQASGPKDLPFFLMFSVSNCVLALIGGFTGLLVSRHWGGFKSAVGKAVLFMSLGTTSWGLGNVVWSFYNFVLHLEVPYPSLADLGFAGAVPLWAIGMYYLSQATGAKFSLRRLRGRVLLIVLPIIAAIASYYFLFVIARNSSFEVEGGLLKIFLDFYYPIGDWVILTLSFLLFGLSFKYLGGKFKWPVFITILGFIVMFLADFSFSYTTTVGTYYNGNISDLLFAIALFVISFGINGLDAKT
ncbi:MAG: Membrane protein [Candidatus Gottesmanbacteria bacterium GW2011_GWB1_43_11]|uniref:Membrane protein n=1 Tax=Candidatus Gottesmanbacteria bacterium GW2011_GWB1_43_11 TaxID=1618446 RepID=A0A0G1EUV1_9BACT|nr:MAG: Membrane protein [Candidatus Gottesmanbacteria bacterium GW2011_GWA2_42_16]KKS55407.1 MAG: Membrane protein [Candidatus Gottesmanbacteria bacterium GW2011_GWA1_42_26]KKS81891.1 MAG: Membrane protein [Candidatus Gottesmanbacteria bacterium GW2011_GWC1_43_10]KKS86811.1 MAG: Membrane protein [Candidatus Gottesmanbacteria bacterium GW2011_GWB1_43_11]